MNLFENASKLSDELGLLDSILFTKSAQLNSTLYPCVVVTLVDKLKNLFCSSSSFYLFFFQKWVDGTRIEFLLFSFMKWPHSLDLLDDIVVASYIMGHRAIALQSSM